MQTIRRSLPLQYALPASLTALAVALWWLLAPTLGVFAPFMLMYPVVMVAGWYGGLRPALFATLLTALARIILSSHPVGDISSLGPSDLIQVLLYTTIAVLISVLSEAMHRARRQAEEHALRAEHHEQELERSEERFRLAAEAVNCLIYDWDPITGRSDRTRGLFELTGFRPEEASPDNDWWRGRIHPDDREHANAAVETALTGNGHYGVTYRVQHRDGHYIHVWDQGLLIRDPAGRVIRVVGSTVDMTPQIEAAAERQVAEEALRHAEEALRANEATLRRLFDANIVGIMMTSSDGFIIDANDALLDVIGYERAELEAGAIRWDAMTPAEHVPKDRDALEQLARTGSCAPYEKEFMKRDGVLVPVLIGAARLDDSADRQICFVVDLSAQKRAEEEMRRSKDEAEAANHAKDHFIAVLSHELRTPLSPVLIMAQTLAAIPDLDEDMRSGLEIIRRNAELEARLIDDLLDLTRIARGKLQLSVEKVDLHQVIRNAIETSSEEIAAKKLALTVDLAAPNVAMNGDPARLQQVFWNVIKNAVKFTPTGGSITIRSGGSERSIWVEVSDTGIGIEKEMIPKIFNAFEQGARASMPHFGGLGLGLAVSRALVELHGGTIIASSDGPDSGATLRIELPVIAGSTEEPGNVPEIDTAGKEDGRRLRILLVDDHRDTSRVFTILLERRGYTVVTAHNVADGLDLALRNEFDLLISDISMPDGTGLDLVRRIRERQPVRAIALSGFGMEEDIRRSLDNGFVDHLVKPVSQQRLFEAISRALEMEETG
jgi:PAS domain S-box-containing protein